MSHLTGPLGFPIEAHLGRVDLARKPSFHAGEPRLS